MYHIFTHKKCVKSLEIQIMMEMLFSALFAIAAEITGFVCGIHLILYDR